VKKLSDILCRLSKIYQFDIICQAFFVNQIVIIIFVFNLATNLCLVDLAMPVDAIDKWCGCLIYLYQLYLYADRSHLGK